MEDKGAPLRKAPLPTLCRSRDSLKRVGGGGGVYPGWSGGPRPDDLRDWKRGSCGLDPVSGDFRLGQPGIPQVRDGQPRALPFHPAGEL